MSDDKGVSAHKSTPTLANEGIEPIWVSLAKAGYVIEALTKLLESKHGRKLIRKLIMENLEEIQEYFWLEASK